MFEEIRQFFAAHCDYIPFMAAVSHPAAIAPRSHLIQRAMETAIIGVIMAGLGYFTVIPRLEERISLESTQTRTDIGELKRKIEEMEKTRNTDYRDLVEKMNLYRNTKPAR